MELEEVQYDQDQNQNISEERIKKLKRILKKCKTERIEYLSGWQRAQADFQNYKKEQEHHMNEFRQFAKSKILQNVLPVLDNFHLASQTLPEHLKNEGWVKGILNIKRHFENILREEGVVEVEIKDDTKYNPAYHEAVEEVPSEKESGTIVEVLQKGYSVDGKLIRPARVKIAK